MARIEEIQVIDSEVKDETTAAQKPTETFAFQWLNRAFRVVKWFNFFALSVVVIQAGLLALWPDKMLIIPGQTAIYWGAALATTALVGGETIADKIVEKGPPKP